MPGIGNIKCNGGNCTGSSYAYPAIAGYINNSSFNIVMSYNWNDFFLPSKIDISTYKIGYSQTRMPLDASALRWMYNLSSAGEAYIDNFGVKVINPEKDEKNSDDCWKK